MENAAFYERLTALAWIIIIHKDIVWNNTAVHGLKEKEARDERTVLI